MSKLSGIKVSIIKSPNTDKIQLVTKENRKIDVKIDPTSVKMIKEHNYIVPKDRNILNNTCKFIRCPYDAKLVQCQVCVPPELCEKATLINSTKLNEKIDISCGYCDKTLKRKISFHYHWSSFHSNSPEAETIQSTKNEGDLMAEETIEDDIEMNEMKGDQEYEGTSAIEWVVDEVIASCVFISDQRAPKQVKCVACIQDCPVTDSINNMKLNEKAEIPCICGSVLFDRSKFYKHFVFFHGGKKTKTDTKSQQHAEDSSHQIDSDEDNLRSSSNKECRFIYDTTQKSIKCIRHEPFCVKNEKIAHAKCFEAIHLKCFCGKILKSRRSFQKHHENIHLKQKFEDPNEAEETTLNNDDSIAIQVDNEMTCRFTRDPTNKKNISCVNCINHCPMASKIQSSKFFEELYIPCECGKILKTRSNFFKHHMVYHEMGIGRTPQQRKRKSRGKVKEDSDLDEEFDNSNCRFKRDDEDPKLLFCVTCDCICPFAKKIRSATLKDKIYITCFCGKSLKDRKQYFKHFNFEHSGGRMRSLTCRRCGITFETERLKLKHDKMIHQREYRYTCHLCDKTFHRSDYLSRHLKTCGKESEIFGKDHVLACGICNFTFKGEEAFQKHMKTAHVNATVDDDEFMVKAVEYSKTYDKTGTKNLDTCKHCGMKFEKRDEMKNHMKEFHKDKMIECEKCDEYFLHQSTKDSHMTKKHGLRRRYECELCEYSCNKRILFKAHMAKHENPDIKFPCPICHQEFNSINTMAMHRSRHRVIDPFVCEFCNKEFISKVAYKNHVKLHTREGLFQCQSCDKEFIKKESLKRHQVKENHL